MRNADRSSAREDRGELFRALAVLCEPPGAATAAVGEALNLGPPPPSSIYTDLFVLQLYPYASVYLSNEGMLGGEARDRIAGFWRALGETPPNEPDHLAILLAQYANLLDAEAGARDAEQRRRISHARGAFLWEHLLSWLPVYLDKLIELEPAFYSEWAELLQETLVKEAAAVGEPNLLPLHLRESRRFEADGESAANFLAALLAPVRTGFIVVRDDLIRCAKDLGLAARQGERRYVLEALLSQSAAQTVGWLTREAARWARHGNGASGVAPVSTFWAGRANATCDALEALSLRDRRS